jgi:hypothetical protein
MAGTNQRRANIAVVNPKTGQITAKSVLIIHAHLHRPVANQALQRSARSRPTRLANLRCIQAQQPQFSGRRTIHRLDPQGVAI